MATRTERHRLSFGEIERLIHAAVERVAATDAQPEDPFRGMYVSDELALSLAREGPRVDPDERLDEAAARLTLSALELRVLAVCLAVELDPRYGRLFGYLHDDLTRRFASPRLVAQLLSGPECGEHEVLACFGRELALRRTGALSLLEGDAELALAERPLRVAARVVSHVLGVRLDSPGPADGARLVGLPFVALGRPDTVARVSAAAASGAELALAVVGPDAAEILAAALEAPVLAADLRLALDDAVLLDLGLAARLGGARLCFEGGEDLSVTERRGVIAALSARGEPVLLCLASRAALVALDGFGAVAVEVPLPTPAERRVLWRAHAGVEHVDDVAARFSLGAGQIARAAQLARIAAHGRSSSSSSSGAAPRAADLQLGARAASSRRLEGLATRIEPTNGFDDLVLPDRQIDWLRSISAHLRHRELVMSVWGYGAVAGPGQGLKVLFFGDSGTGKTMAAGALARDLGLELYRIDLAAVVSKYIGETEQNLDRIFAAAEGSNAILFFDEADALFGKRSEVGDAHDRYANIEVAYLLTRIESYPGTVILATNFRNNIDDAFLRRLDFAVEFPFPEPEQRCAIWHAVLPAAAPLGDDLDCGLLAQEFRLSGGSIRNCSIAAAFLAAQDGGPIEMRHLRRAVAFEYAKLGRLTLGGEASRGVAGGSPRTSGQ